MSMSDSESKGFSPRDKRVQMNKIFVTGLDGAAKTADLESELRELFSRYGKIEACVVKTSRNGDYCFAFVEYQPGEDAEEAVRNLNGHNIRGKFMKVELQDDSKRRKDPDKGCYTCGKKGHFARECRSRNGSRGYRGRSRSRSRSYEHKKRSRRSYSYSSERDRSHHKKSRKNHSRDRDEKKKKKHKKHRKRSSSGSYS